MNDLELLRDLVAATPVPEGEPFPLIFSIESPAGPVPRDMTNAILYAHGRYPEEDGFFDLAVTIEDGPKGHATVWLLPGLGGWWLEETTDGVVSTLAAFKGSASEPSTITWGRAW